MKVALFKDGELINIIVADEEFANAYCAEMGYEWSEVQEDPVPEPEPVPDPLEQRLSEIEDAIIELAAIIAGEGE